MEQTHRHTDTQTHRHTHTQTHTHTHTHTQTDRETDRQTTCEMVLTPELQCSIAAFSKSLPPEAAHVNKGTRLHVKMIT